MVSIEFAWHHWHKSSPKVSKQMEPFKFFPCIVLVCFNSKGKCDLGMRLYSSNSKRQRGSQLHLVCAALQKMGIMWNYIKHVNEKNNGSNLKSKPCSLWLLLFRRLWSWTLATWLTCFKVVNFETSMQLLRWNPIHPSHQLAFIRFVLFRCVAARPAAWNGLGPGLNKFERLTFFHFYSFLSCMFQLFSIHAVNNFIQFPIPWAPHVSHSNSRHWGVQMLECSVLCVKDCLLCRNLCKYVYNPHELLFMSQFTGLSVLDF